LADDFEATVPAETVSFSRTLSQSQEFEPKRGHFERGQKNPLDRDDERQGVGKGVPSAQHAARAIAKRMARALPLGNGIPPVFTGYRKPDCQSFRQSPPPFSLIGRR
jgi:hypothetical protein